MAATDVLLLLAAGLAGGAVNAVAGGGSLLTFPALLATGMPPVAANVTNSVSVCPGYLASVAGSGPDLVGQRRRTLELLPTTAAGTTVGCLVLLTTPARAFEFVVPFLVLAAATMLAFTQRLRTALGAADGRPRRRHPVRVHLLVGAGAVYGGYFGAALGVMLVAVLAVVLDEPMQRVGALKNALSATVGVVTAIVFGVFGPVDWIAVATLAPATLAGGYLGALVARRMSAAVLRWSIVGFGTAVGIVLLVRAPWP